MADLEKLDAPWIAVGERRSMKWYRGHPSTKELLNSCVLRGNVLDIGCGTGQRAFIAHEQSKCNLVGIDGSAYAINYANEKFSVPTLKYVFGDVTSMPFLDNSFDNAYMLAVIEHILDTELLLFEIKRVVVPKGKLFVDVTQNDYHASPDHVHVFSETSLRETFREYRIINDFVKSHRIFMTVEMPGRGKKR